MKLNNGKEINILKHFKLKEDEYIIYETTDTILLGQIIDNKITIPSSDKINNIKTVIGCFITDNPSGCAILDNEISADIEEISSQQIKLTENQLNTLKK